MNRRRVLVGTGVAFSTAVAGCSDSEADSDASADDRDGQDGEQDDADLTDADDQRELGEDSSGFDDRDDREREQSDDEDSQARENQQDGEGDGGDDQPAESHEEEPEDEADGDAEEDEHDEREAAEDVDGEVILPELPGEHLEEAAADHLAVRNQAFTAGDSDDECEVHIQLEKTSADTHLVSFGIEVTVYSAAGERIASREHAGERNAALEQGDREVYSLGVGPCEGAAAYRAEIVQFGVSVPVDELEAAFTADAELDDKLEIEDHEFSWDGTGTPTHGTESARTSVSVTNVTDDYRLSVTGPDGADDSQTIDLEPGDTGTFHSEADHPADIDSYGFELEATAVTAIEEDTDVTDLPGEVVISERDQDYVAVTDHSLREHPATEDDEDTDWCLAEVEAANVSDDDVRWIRVRCKVSVYKEAERAYQSRQLLDEELETSSSSSTPGETFEFSLPLRNCADATEYEVEVYTTDIHY